MSTHRWGNPDAKGARACNNEGCSVRVADSFRRWQPRKGAHWKIQAWELIPLCAGKEAGEAKPAPSPLEVVRERLKKNISACDWQGCGTRRVCDDAPERERCVFCKARDTVDFLLATLEESIRKDEREKCIADAAKHCVCATDAAAGCGCSACKTAETILNRK